MKLRFLLLFSSTLFSMAKADELKLDYALSFTEPQAHYVNVSMTVSGLAREQLDLKMAVWAPGSYLIREFPKNVEGFRALAGKKELQSEKISKNTWRIHTADVNEVTVTYRVYAFEMSVRTSFVDADHAFLNGTSIFMYVDQELELPSTVKIMPDPSWKKISTGLEADPDDPFLLSSPNYDILADSPIEIGNQDVIRFTAAGVPHEVAIFGGGEYTREGVVEGFTKVIEEQTAVFGENPCERYVFIVHFLASGGGGLEHLNSTTLQFSRGRLGSEKGWASFMGLVAHEYFHLWNVKRLRPIALGPFDYGTENYTHMLWFSEGFTAYYDDWTVRRTGFATPEEYLVTLAGVIGTVENTPGNLVQPVADASFDAWIKYYRPNENSYNTTVSYYSKGAILGLLMDMAIRKSSQGKQTLDDFMRYMYEKYYKQLDRGFKDEEFKKEAIKFAPALDGFFEKYVWGTETIPYNDFFSTVGLKLVDSPAHEDESYLGASLQRVDQGFVVTRVVRGSAAWKYGLNVNDLIVSANGRRTSDQSDLLQGTSPGDRISVKLVRDGQLRDVELVLGGNPQRSFRFEFLKDATTQQKVNYKNWMGM